MKANTRGNRRGGVSTHFVASLVVIAVVVVVLLLVQRRAYNPTLTMVQQPLRTQRLRMPLPPTVIPDTAYVEAASFKLDMDQPRALALGPGSELFVVGDKDLLKLDKQGRLIQKDSLASEPYAVAVAPDKTTFIGYRDYVEARKPDGSVPSKWPKLGKRAYITSLCASDGKIWVADAGERRVLEYDGSGKLLRTLGERNPSKNVPGLVVPSAHMDVALDSEGSLWVANTGRHSIEKYGEDGSVVSSWGRAGPCLDDFCGCCNPSDFAIGPKDVFVTVEKGLLRVKEYSKEGKLQSLVTAGKEFGGGAVCEVAAPVGGFVPGHSSQGTSLDLAVAADGSIYALDPVSRSVRMFKLK